MQTINRVNSVYWAVVYRDVYDVEGDWTIDADDLGCPRHYSSRETAESACEAYRAYWPQEAWEPVLITTTEIWSME